MPRTDLQQIFLQSASEVLETMFFTALTEEDAQEVSGALVCAELTFLGTPSGRFGIRVAHPAGRVMAASFLGMEEADVSEEQVAEVVCELTNMICGSVLSRVEAGARFELMHPEIDRRRTDWRQLKEVTGSTFGVEDGTITLWMAFQANQSALVA